MNRSLSIRSKKSDNTSSSIMDKVNPRGRFNMSSLRSMQQPDLSRKLAKLIKSENHVISAHETAGRERVAIAGQLSQWGESTGDDAISDLSVKLGVLLAEIGEQEDLYAHHLEDYRSVLKQIRDCEAGVQPSRDHKSKTADEIQKLKYKEPTSPKIEQLEQELVRAEAQSLVAEAQLTNITRQKFRIAHDVLLKATIERAEKQIILARHARRMVSMVDDTPIVPGGTHPAWEGSQQAQDARQIINEAEEDLRSWHSQEQELPGGYVEPSAEETTSAADANAVQEHYQPEKIVAETPTSHSSVPVEEQPQQTQVPQAI